MKILFCVRKDYLTRSAGDTIQVLNSKRVLESMGVEVDIKNTVSENYDGYDIIHIFNITRIQESYMHYMKGRKFKIPIVISPIFWDLTTYYKENNMVNLLEKWNSGMNMRKKILEGSQCILPNSLIEESHLKHMFETSKKFDVIYNGCCISDYSDIEEQSDTILCSARITPRKNQLILSEICSELGIRLHLIGAVNDKNYLRKCLQFSNVKYIGYFSHSEVLKRYGRYKMHVLPSYLETPGLSSLESGAAGCSVVSTNVGSCKEYLGDLADYCNPLSKESIIEAIERGKTRNKDDNEKLSNFLRENFTWETVIEKLFRVYSEII